MSNREISSIAAATRLDCLNVIMDDFMDGGVSDEVTRLGEGTNVRRTRLDPSSQDCNFVDAWARQRFRIIGFVTVVELGRHRVFATGHSLEQLRFQRLVWDDAAAVHQLF